MNRASRSIENFSAEIFTEKELSRRWKLDPKTLRNWRCQGRGPGYFKIGVSVRYPTSEILRVEEESKMGFQVAVEPGQYPPGEPEIISP